MNDFDDYNDEHDPHKKSHHNEVYLIEGMIYVLVVAIVLAILCSCTIVSYEALPGQGTTVSIWSLGSDKALTDFKASIDPKGARKLSIGAFDEVQSEGLKQVNQGLKMMVEGAVAGMK